MLRSADVAGWLVDRGIAEPMVFVTELPAMPDRVCSVAMTGGGPTLRERSFDQAQLQVVCRGAQADPGDAEAFAEQIDDVLMGAVPPVVMNGRRVASIDRLSPPQRLEVDAGRRTVMVTNFILQTARSVF